MIEENARLHRENKFNRRVTELVNDHFSFQPTFWLMRWFGCEHSLVRRTQGCQACYRISTKWNIKHQALPYFFLPSSCCVLLEALPIFVSLCFGCLCPTSYLSLYGFWFLFLWFLNLILYRIGFGSNREGSRIEFEFVQIYFKSKSLTVIALKSKLEYTKVIKGFAWADCFSVFRSKINSTQYHYYSRNFFINEFLALYLNYIDGLGFHAYTFVFNYWSLRVQYIWKAWIPANIIHIKF